MIYIIFIVTNEFKRFAVVLTRLFLGLCIISNPKLCTVERTNIVVGQFIHVLFKYLVTSFDELVTFFICCCLGFCCNVGETKAKKVFAVSFITTELDIFLHVRDSLSCLLICTHQRGNLLVAIRTQGIFFGSLNIVCYSCVFIIESFVCITSCILVVDIAIKTVLIFLFFDISNVILCFLIVHCFDIREEEETA